MEKLHQLTQQYQELADFLRQFRQERHRFLSFQMRSLKRPQKLKVS